MELHTDGSELIRERIPAEDEQPLFIQLWGGANTVVRALKDIEERYADGADCESKDTLRAAFMDKYILHGNVPLLDGYCTYMDGTRYEGEPEEGQFGTNPELLSLVNGWLPGAGSFKAHDFLSEGDSPCGFFLFDRGFRTAETESMWPFVADIQWDFAARPDGASRKMIPK